MRNASMFEAVAGIIFFGLIVSLAIWWDVSVWQECRAFGHSWFYCFNLLGNK